MKFTPLFIPLAKGEKSEIDERILGTGQGVLSLENALIYQKEQIIKRAGTAAIGTNLLDGTTMPVPYRLAQRDGSLVSLSSYGATSPVQSFSPTRNAWVPAAGNARGPTWFRRHSVAGGTNLQSPDVAYVTGYYATAHLDAFGAVVTSIMDETSKKVIYSNTNNDKVFTNVKIIGSGTKFYEFYTISDVTLYARVFNPADLSSTPVTTLDDPGDAGGDFNCQLDAMKVGADAIKIVFATDLASIRYVDYTPSSGAHSAGALSDGSSNPIPSSVLGLVRDLGASGKVGLLTAADRAEIGGAGGGLRLHWDIIAGTTTSSFLLIDASFLPQQHLLQLCGHTRSSNASGDVIAFLEVAGAGATTHAAVRVAGALPGTFSFSGAANSNTSGVGATLTASGNGITTVDGQDLVINDRVLVNVASTGVTDKEFGIYEVTTEGDSSHATILTRATDADAGTECAQDILVNVTAGSANAGKQFFHHPDQTAVWVFPLLGSGGPGRPSFTWAEVPETDLTTDQAQRWKRIVHVGARNPSVGSSRATWMLGLGLSSVPFTLHGKTFLLANYDNTPTGSGFDVLAEPNGTQPLQSLYFLLEAPADTTISSLPLVDFPATSQANIAVGNGGGIQIVSSLPSVVTNAAGEAVVALRVRNSGQAKSPDRAIEICRIDTSAALGNHAEANGSLYVPGGALTAFDGTRHAALGFQVYPEPPVFTSQFTGLAPDGFGTDGTWRYAHVYRWTDANGKIHRSAPSFVDVTPPLPGTPSRIQLFLTSYRLGDKVITSELYRSTKDVLDVLYLINDTGPLSSIDNSAGTGSESSAENDPTVMGVTYTDGLSDDEIVSHELLYTDGGVLSNDPIPGALEVCVHGGRVCFTSMDDPHVVYYSSVDNGFDAPHFSTTGILVEPEPVQALASFCESLYLFTDSVRYIAPSDGPDALGRGLFPRSVALAPGISTETPLSVCKSPVGLFFRPRDPKAGFYMVSTGRQVQPAGVDVQRHSDMVTKAVLFVEGSQTARIFSTTGTLVYDVMHDQWSVFTGQLAATATMWGQTPVYATAAGSIWKEAPGTYLEAGVAFGMAVESPWIQLALTKAGVVTNIHGFYRYRRIQGVGKRVGAHDLSVKLYRDYDAATVLASYSGTPGAAWDWFMRHSAKLSALKVRIEETGSTAGPIINGIMLELGAKEGASRLSTGKQLTPG